MRGPTGSTFAGSHLVACAEISEEEHQVIMTVLQPLGWRCVECAIHHERDVREEQHRYIRDANKQQQSDRGV